MTSPDAAQQKNAPASQIQSGEDQDIHLSFPYAKIRCSRQARPRAKASPELGDMAYIVMNY